MYLSVRDDIVFAAGYAALAEGVRDLGLSSIELLVQRDDTVHALIPEEGKTRLNLQKEADRNALAMQCAQSGVAICAFCMGNNFNNPDREAELAWAARTMHAADALAVPVIRVDAIMSDEGHLPLERRQQIVAGALRDLLDQTSSLAVELGIENHGTQGNDPDFLRGLLADVDSERLGLTLDSGNFYWRGWPLQKVYEIFEEFAPVVKHTHIKNIAYPPEIRQQERPIGYEYGKYVCPIHHGDIDHQIYVSLLKKAGYQRDLCLEDESIGHYLPPQRQKNLRDAALTLQTYL